MASTELQHDDLDVEIVPSALDLRTPTWDRFTSALKSLAISGVCLWLATGLILQLSQPNMRWRSRHRLALMVAIPAAAFLALRRYAFQYHRLTCNRDLILLQNSLGRVEIDPDDVQGLVGTGGVNFDASDTDIWKEVVLLAGGKRYAISFDKVTSSLCYQQLRGLCVHAWGIPFKGQLEPPAAGPELDSEEYVDALRRVHAFYWRYTFKTLFSGLLMMVASGIAALALSKNLLGRRVGRLIFWTLVLAFFGLLLTIRAFRQIPVLQKVRATERRLREAI